LRVNHLDADGQDDSIFLDLINQYDVLIIQDKNDAANYQKWEVSGTPTYNATWDLFPVTLIDSAGTGTTNFASNHPLLFIIISVGNVGPKGDTGDVGAQGPSGVISVTAPITNSGTSTSAVIGIDQSNLAKLNTANTFTVGGQVINNDTASNIPLVVRGFGTGDSSTQSVDLQQWNTYNGTTSTNVAKITKDGVANFAGISVSGNSVFNYTTTFQNSVVIPLIAKNLGGTADIQQWQNSVGTVLGGRNALGQIYSGSATAVGGSNAATIYSVQINSSTEGQINFVTQTGLAIGDLVVVTAASGISIIPAATYIITNVLNSGTNNLSYIKFSLVGATITAQTTTASSLPASVTPFAQASFTSRSAGTPALLMRNSSGQIADIMQVRVTTDNTTWGATSGFSSLGSLYVRSGASLGGSLSVGTNFAYGTGQVIRGVFGQVNDLLQLQNTNSTVISGFGAAGELFSGSTAPSSNSFATPIAIASSTQSTTTVTYNTTYNHGLVVGQYVNVINVTTTPVALAHNLSGVVNTVPSTTQFTLLTATSGSNTSSGTGTVSSTRNQAFIQGTSTYSGALKLKASPNKVVTVTAASGNGTTVTYTAAQSGYNALIVGDTVTITGLGISSGSSLNLASQVIVTSSATQFTVTNSTVGVSSGTGTATVFQYPATLTIENAAGVVVNRVDADGSLRTQSIANVAAYSNANLTPQTTGWILAGSAATTSIPLKIQNANAGTISGDLTQWLNNTGSTVLASVGFDGAIRTIVGFGSTTGGKTFAYPNYDTGAFGFFGGTGTDKKLVVRGTGTGGSYTQTADLQQWQTYDGTTATTVAKVDASGNIFAPSIIETGYVSTTGDQTILPTTSFFEVAGTPGTVTLTLPNGVNGKKILIRNISTTSSGNIVSSGSNIIQKNSQGSPTNAILPAIYGAWALLVYSSSSALWKIISSSAYLEDSSNTASTVVLRDSSGNFSAGTITATSFSGPAASITSLTAGTLATTNVIADNMFKNQSSIRLTSATATNSTTTPAAIFVASGVTGAITLEANCTYVFRGAVLFNRGASGSAATGNITFSFSNTQQDIYTNVMGTTNSPAVSTSVIANISSTNVFIVTNSGTAAASYFSQFSGSFRTNATTGGTMTPQFAQSVAGNATIGAGSWLVIEKIASSGNGIISGSWT
jgi:hypothetical protein